MSAPAREQVPDLMLTLVVLGLCSIGLVLIYSTSGILALQRMGDSYHFVKHQLLYLALGTLAALWAMRVDLKRWREFAGPLMAVSLVLMAAVLVPGVGHRVGGARRWLGFGPLVFQPTELAKFALAVFVADRVTRPREKELSWRSGLAPVVGVVLAGCALMMLEPDFGSTALFFLLATLMLFCSGLPVALFVLPVGAALPLAWMFISHSAYRLERWKTFLDPWRDPQGKGFQMTHSFMAFGSGGLFGAGLGAGIQKLYYLPEPHTDFIFSTAGEELGFLGCLVILFLFVLLLWRGTMIALHSRDLFAKLLALGLTALLGLQMIVNLYVVLGLAPTKGTTLPFISYGGSAVVMDLLAVGLLLNISRFREAA